MRNERWQTELERERVRVSQCVVRGGWDHRGAQRKSSKAGVTRSCPDKGSPGFSPSVDGLVATTFTCISTRSFLGHLSDH